MSVKAIVVIHFQPLEYYPPILNTLQFFAGRLTDQRKLYVITTRHSNKLPVFTAPNERIIIKRFPGIRKEEAGWKRMLKYIWFYAGTFLYLIFTRPAKVLYYETLSSFPAVLYKLIRPRVDLLVHYHEYNSPQQYKNGMMLNRKFHQWEKKIYSRVAWLSHVHEVRMQLFLEDNAGIAIPNTHILPNYPPLSWSVSKQEHHFGNPVKLVYVGALSLKTMFTKEICEWVTRQNGIFILDIYSYNMQEEARQYIQELASPYIRLKPGVDYFSLPSILKNYDIGIIIYKGVSINHVQSAPNKLFEYLACGLDTWCSAALTGCAPFFRKDVYPKVIPVHFDQLVELDYKPMIDRTGTVYQPTDYYTETVLEPLTEVLRHH